MIYTKADLKRESAKKLWIGIAIGGSVCAVIFTGILAAKKYIPLFREYRSLKAWREEQERNDLINRFGTTSPHSSIFDRFKNGISHSLSDDDMFEDDFDSDLIDDLDDEIVGEDIPEDTTGSID